MSNPSPILIVTGRVHSVDDRQVPSVDARPEERDENGNVVKSALPAREGYDVTDVTLLTEDGGFCTVSLLPKALQELDGLLPSRDDVVEFAVRPYVSWQRYGGRSVARVGLSCAGDVTAKRRTGSNGRRAVSAVGS